MRDGNPRGPVHVGETCLLARRTETESPAYSVIEIEPAAGIDGRRPERSLLAESCWGDSVHPPGVFALLLWMFSRLPLLVVGHFFGGLQPNPSSPMPSTTIAHRRKWDAPVPDWLALAGKSVLTPLLIQVMQAVVLVAGILSLVPFGAWREALLTAVRVMTLTLGDSYVLLEQDIQRAALSDRVARSLQWLQARVDRVPVRLRSRCRKCLLHVGVHRSDGVDGPDDLRSLEQRRHAAHWIG